ncbi:MAG: DUF86 domain-containing protein [Thermoproteus sp.]
MLHDKLLENIIRYVDSLEGARKRGVNWSDIYDVYSVLHALQIYAQSVIDYLLHTCSILDMSGETPIRCIRNLVGAGLLDADDGEVLRRLVGFRNIVVHEYGEVDVERVRRVVEAGGYVRVAEIIKKLHYELRRRGLLDP